MLIHYVDDNKTDLLSLKRALRDEKSVQLRTCQRMDQIPGFKDVRLTDAFVLDVVRPDAVSIEADIKEIRTYTDAPVLFLTGQDPESIRDQALLAGALAVLNKDRTNPAFLLQILEQACSLRRHSEPAEETAPQPQLEALLTPSGQWPMQAPTLAACDEMLAFIEEAIGSSQTAIAKADQPATKLLRLMRRIAARRFASSVLVDASRIMTETFDTISPDFLALDIKVTIDLMGNAPFWTIGSRQDAECGIRTLVEGAAHLSQKGERLHIDVGCLHGLTRIDFTSKQALVSSHDELFRSHVLLNEQPSFGLCLLQVACHLLALRPEQVVFSGDGFHRVSFFL